MCQLRVDESLIWTSKRIYWRVYKVSGPYCLFQFSKVMIHYFALYKLFQFLIWMWLLAQGLSITIQHHIPSTIQVEFGKGFSLQTFPTKMFCEKITPQYSIHNTVCIIILLLWQNMFWNFVLEKWNGFH